MRKSRKDYLFIGIVLFLAMVFFAEIYLNNEYESQYKKIKEKECYAYEKKRVLPPLHIALLSDTNIVLFCGNEKKKLPLASTTKILTAITVLENIENVDEKYVVPNEAVGVEGSSVYLTKGEMVSVKELTLWTNASVR